MHRDPQRGTWKWNSCQLFIHFLTFATWKVRVWIRLELIRLRMKMFSSRVTHVFVRTGSARDGVWHETSGEKTDGCPRGAVGGRWIRSQKSGVQPWLQPQEPSASEQDISLFIASVSLPGKRGGKWACVLWNPWATIGECARQNERSHVLQATKSRHSQINKH